MGHTKLLLLHNNIINQWIYSTRAGVIRLTYFWDGGIPPCQPVWLGLHIECQCHLFSLITKFVSRENNYGGDLVTELKDLFLEIHTETFCGEPVELINLYIKVGNLFVRLFNSSNNKTHPVHVFYCRIFKSNLLKLCDALSVTTLPCLRSIDLAYII